MVSWRAKKERKEKKSVLVSLDEGAKTGAQKVTQAVSSHFITRTDS